MDEPDDPGALWRAVDELTAQLPPADRRAVRDAVANNALAGWQPTREEITDLIAYATGNMSMAEYLTRAHRTTHDNTN